MGNGYNMVKGPGFLGLSGRDQSKNAQGQIADPFYGKEGSYSLRNGREYFEASEAKQVQMTIDKFAKDQGESSGKTAQDAELAALAAPSLTDETLAKARKSAFLKLTSGQGRKSTFSSGPEGDLSMPAKKSLPRY